MQNMSKVKKRHHHCVKSVLIRSYSGPHFPAFGLNTVRMGENADQNNSEYGHFLRSADQMCTTKFLQIYFFLLF